jgi:hypothetical protein
VTETKSAPITPADTVARDVGIDWNRPKQNESWDVSSSPMHLPQAPPEEVDWRARVEESFHPVHGGWHTPSGQMWAAVIEELRMLRLVCHWQGAGLSKLEEDSTAVYAGLYEQLVAANTQIAALSDRLVALEVQRDMQRSSATR